MVGFSATMGMWLRSEVAVEAAPGMGWWPAMPPPRAVQSQEQKWVWAQERNCLKNLRLRGGR